MSTGPGQLKRPRRIFAPLLLSSFCGLLLLTITLLIWVVFFGGVDTVTGYLFRHRHPPSDIEMAPTVVAYPSGPDVAAIIGGKGQGLDCSIPWPVGPALFGRGPFSDQAPVELQFRQACVFHDLCYRHGLATYGYTQADCDALLQEHASRICKQAFRASSWAQCHSDSRKVLLGVSLGGTNAFQGWWTSTFHEFDPIPVRSREFIVSRLVKGPAGADPVVNDRTQLLTLRVQPSGLTLSEPGTDNPARMTELRRGWNHSAPFVRTGTEPRDTLYWYLRSREQNTAALLTAGNVEEIRAGRFKLVNTDILASSPIFAPTAHWSEPLLGLTRQSTTDGRLEVCGADSASARVDKRKCATIGPALDQRTDTTHAPGDIASLPAVKTTTSYRLFQSSPLVTNDHLVVLKRGAAENGEGYRDAADALVLDLAKLGGTSAPHDTVTRVVPDVQIRERDEPVAALPDGAKQPVLLSVVNESGSTSLSLYEFDLGAKGERKPMQVLNRGNPLALESSWVDRPVLLMKPSANDAQVTGRLVFSRARFEEAESKGEEDRVDLGVLVLGRADRAWRVELSAQCKVTFAERQRSVNATPCRAAALGNDGKRVVEASTAVTRLLGAQLLASYSSASGSLTLVVPDQCIPANPIVLEARLDSQNPSAPGNLAPRKREANPTTLRRTIQCDHR
jgi:hypothetical protein